MSFFCSRIQSWIPHYISLLGLPDVLWPVASAKPFLVFHALSFFFFFNLFIYFWLCWVFVSVRGLSLVVASGGHSSSRCAGLSLSRPLLLWSTGSRRAGSVVVAHRPSCSAACGIFPDQGSNPFPLHWQADSQPLRHQGSPMPFLMKSTGQVFCRLSLNLGLADVFSLLNWSYGFWRNPPWNLCPLLSTSNWMI